MDPRRWETIQAAFDQLIELDESSRASRLAALGDTDSALRAAVESLLAADAEASARLAPLEAGFFSEAGTASDPLGLAGRTISHFQVLGPLGAGGMGVVYRAQDTRLGRPVALKFLLPFCSLDATARARFLREARAAAALDHPHLCTIYEVGESDDGQVFLAMPLYTGQTLKTRLARDGPLPLPEALELTKQIAKGLGGIHAAGIVHRDLKPGNVILLPDGTVKILDFGLAKVRDQTASETGTRFGTVAYMAPEQIRGETVDLRADLWAVGVVLYEMLTGRKPFAGEHEVAIAHAIVHDEPALPTMLEGGVPPAVEELVHTLLQKDPTTRYAAVDDLLADLLGVGIIDEVAARSGGPRRLRTRHILPPRRRWWLAAGAVLVLGAFGYTVSASSRLAWLGLDPTGLVARYSIALPDTAGLAGAGFYDHRLAISPNGQHLVYVGSRDVSRRLWVRRRDQLHATLLPGTEGAINPFFSPDGSRVGFVSTGARNALKVVPLGGGSPTTVADSLVDFGGAAWGYDGYIYFDGHLEGDGIARVAETGGLLEAVTMQDLANGEKWHYQPEPLPNGKGVLFMIWRGGDADAGARAGEADVAVVDLESRVHRVLVRGVSPRYAASGHLLYVRADGALMAAPFDQEKLALTGEAVAVAEGLGAVRGTHDLSVSAAGTLVYTASRAAPRELVWVARDGTATPVDSAWRAVFTSVALSPDGAELAVGIQEDSRTHVWIKRLDRKPAFKLTFEGTFNDRPAWTPDGRSVLFVSNSRQNLDLYQRPADGSALPQVVLDEAGYVHEAEYSADGEWLVYRENWRLFAARTDGDGGRMDLVAAPSLQWWPTLSPDGRWLAYSSNEAEGGAAESEVYVRPFPNTESAKWQISTGGGIHPTWSRSGRVLFYINGRAELVETAVLPGATFAVGEQHVLFSRGAEYVPGIRTYDVSPDGTRFIMIRRTKGPRDELIWVENFFEELKAKVKRTRTQR